VPLFFLPFVRLLQCVSVLRFQGLLVTFVSWGFLCRWFPRLRRSRVLQGWILLVSDLCLYLTICARRRITAVLVWPLWCFPCHSGSMFGTFFPFYSIDDFCQSRLLWSLASSPIYLRLIGITVVVLRCQPFWKKVESNVTAGGGGTLGCFTWFHCTWLDSHKVHYCGLVRGSTIDRSNSLAWRFQAYIPLRMDRVELSRCWLR
jgi:hypothetical protein